MIFPVFSEAFVDLWNNKNLRTDEELDGACLLLLRFIQKMVTRTVESEDSKVIKIAPTTKKEACCSQCGLNHEARDFIRAICLHVIDNLEISKPYIDLLKENDFINEEAYSHATTEIEERETTFKWINDEIKGIEESIKYLKSLKQNQKITSS